jgi:hypothetical protein
MVQYNIVDSNVFLCRLTAELNLVSVCVGLCEVLRLAAAEHKRKVGVLSGYNLDSATNRCLQCSILTHCLRLFIRRIIGI